MACLCVSCSKVRARTSSLRLTPRSRWRLLVRCLRVFIFKYPIRWTILVNQFAISQSFRGARGTCSDANVLGRPSQLLQVHPFGTLARSCRPIETTKIALSKIGHKLLRWLRPAVAGGPFDTQTSLYRPSICHKSYSKLVSNLLKKKKKSMSIYSAVWRVLRPKDMKCDRENHCSNEDRMDCYNQSASIIIAHEKMTPLKSTIYSRLVCTRIRARASL